MTVTTWQVSAEVSRRRGGDAQGLTDHVDPVVPEEAGEQQDETGTVVALFVREIRPARSPAAPGPQQQGGKAVLVTFVTAALAILGTLLGAIVSGRFQERAAERAVRIGHSETIRRDRLEAVTALAVAVSDHRRTLWDRGEAILKGADAELIQALRVESRATRAAVARPLVSMRVLITDRTVREAADRMITLTYAIREALDDAQALATARQEAVAAHDEFVNTAARYLTAQTG
ncbi:hypothetical protein ACFUJU_24800 [Streptomyces sp. NPDC057235]|uniref:hypothetical protein n=1 Tax=Streptomyces sp. NPDC057235 TaxID=3346058 RepID=UPI0036266424